MEEEASPLTRRWLLMYLRQAEAGQIAGGLGASYDESLTISQIQSAYQAASETASGYAGMLGDRRVDARQTGSAIAPLLGVNLSLSEQFNIGIKYEFLTRLELENDTETDETGMFPDGAKTRSDMPAMLSVGAAYKATPKLNVAGGCITISTNRPITERQSVENALKIIDNNFIELALGLEYEPDPQPSGKRRVFEDNDRCERKIPGRFESQPVNQLVRTGRPLCDK
jgi:hypothetical protein